MSTTFAQLGVPESIYRALEGRGITEPFQIQAATIGDALAGHDVCGRAPTGSGKTIAFGIPLVATIGRAEPRRPRGLVLAPTRELADQISRELRSIAGKVRISVVYGGVGYGPQRSALQRGVDILVACPGRLEDLIQMGEVDLSDVDHVVLDEADRMADMGFMPAVRRLLDQVSPDRQTVLFSATLDGDIAKLSRDYQNDPVTHEVGEETPDITLAHHFFWRAERSDRAQLTVEAINAVWPAIVFTRTRHGADRLAKQLGKSGIAAAAIHGGRSQNQRTRALKDFGDNRVHALVATDVAARGIHVDGVAAVIHFDPPEDNKAYIHRSGRTARAGESGVVLSLLSHDQEKDARKVQRQVGLDEPIISPDPARMREISNHPELALAAPPERTGNDERTSGSRRGGGGTSGGRGRGQGNGRSGGSQGSRSKGGGSGNKKRSDNNRKARRAPLQTGNS